jgi:hypothetical protein
MGSSESFGIQPGSGFIRITSCSNASSSSPCPQVTCQLERSPITLVRQCIPTPHPFLRAPRRKRTKESNIASRRSAAHCLSVQVLELDRGYWGHWGHVFITGQLSCQLSVRSPSSREQVVTIFLEPELPDPLVYSSLPVSIPGGESLFTLNPHMALFFDPSG